MQQEVLSIQDYKIWETINGHNIRQTMYIYIYTHTHVYEFIILLQIKYTHVWSIKN